MKNTFLLIAALAATAASTFASPDHAAPVMMPTYTVEAPRRTAAEAKVDASLAELRRTARTVVTPALHLPAPIGAEPKVRTDRDHVTAAHAEPVAFRVAVKA